MSMNEWKEWIDNINPESTRLWAYQDRKGVMHYFDQKPTNKEFLEERILCGNSDERETKEAYKALEEW